MSETFFRELRLSRAYLPFSIRIVGPAGVDFTVNEKNQRCLYNDRAKFATRDEADDFLDTIEAGWRAAGYVIDVVNKDGE
jgi:hypothetical protein